MTWNPRLVGIPLSSFRFDLVHENPMLPTTLRRYDSPPTRCDSWIKITWQEVLLIQDTPAWCRIDMITRRMYIFQHWWLYRHLPIIDMSPTWWRIDVATRRMYSNISRRHHRHIRAMAVLSRRSSDEEAHAKRVHLTLCERLFALRISRHARRCSRRQRSAISRAFGTFFLHNLCFLN